MEANVSRIQDEDMPSNVMHTDEILNKGTFASASESRLQRRMVIYVITYYKSMRYPRSARIFDLNHEDHSQNNAAESLSG